jgi:hypothetical protein
VIEPDCERHRLRGGFDDAAAAYDRTRPVCPSAVRYPFAREYSASDYLANLRTQSVTRQLSGEARVEFLARVEARLRRFGWPNLTASFVGLLTVGRVISPVAT